MIKRDYILRWTQELAKVIARLLGKSPELQLEIMEESFEELLGLDIEKLDHLPPEDLLAYLTLEQQYNEGQLEFLAEILYRQGGLLLESSQNQLGHRRLQTALLIFELLDNQQDIFSFERQARMQAIREELDKI